MKRDVCVLGLVALVSLMIPLAGCPCCLEDYSELQASLTPTNPTVKSGEALTIQAIPRGGKGPYTYDWVWYGENDAVATPAEGQFTITPGFGFSGSKAYDLSVTICDCDGQAATATTRVTIVSRASVGGDKKPDGHEPEPEECKAPTIRLMVDGNDDEVTVTANADDRSLVRVSWTATNAAELTISFSPEVATFDGTQELSCPAGGVSVTLGVGTWTLTARAESSCGKTATATVVVRVRARDEPEETLELIDVSMNPNDDVEVGDLTTFTIQYTGSGAIYYLLPDSTVVGSLEAPAGRTSVSFDHIWPMPVDDQAFFWPDDRNSEPDLVEVDVVVLQPD